MKHLENYGLSKEVISKFVKYSNLLLEWNSKFNLTAITDLDEIQIKHFIDSIYIEKFVELDGKSLVDVGSGAGFPGIPLAITHPNLDVTLVESSDKKCKFLELVKEELGLKNVTVIRGRSEDLKNLYEKFDYVTARAVKQLNILLEICSHLLKICGEFLAYKGSDANEEIKESKRAFERLNLELEKVHSYELPVSGDPRNLIVIKKIKATPKKYPRQYSEIVNKPL